METLPKEIKIEVALNLNPIDLINLCSTNKKYKEEICNSRDFWARKLRKDFPDVYDYFVKNKLVLKNPKNTYLRKFNQIFTIIEDFFNIEEAHEKGFGISDDDYVYYRRNKEEINKNVYNIYNRFIKEGKNYDGEEDEKKILAELNKMKENKLVQKILKTRLSSYFINVIRLLFENRTLVK